MIKLKKNQERKVNIKERAVTVGILLSDKAKWELESSMEELAQLCETAGAKVAAEVVQKRSSPERAFYIGKGKAEEIANLVKETKADLVVISFTNQKFRGNTRG